VKRFDMARLDNTEMEERTTNERAEIKALAVIWHNKSRDCKGREVQA
jgi:hypothetical protein